MSKKFTIFKLEDISIFNPSDQIIFFSVRHLRKQSVQTVLK